jgi:hypothetical protein
MPVKRWPRLRAVLPLLYTAPFVSCLAACGGSYQTVKVKSYTLSLAQGDRVFVDTFKQLVAEFNKEVGQPVLTYVDDPSAANSPIILTKGLESSTDGKVGLGQWISESRADNPFTTMPGQRLGRTVTYSMRIEFDWDFFDQRRGATSSNDTDKRKLFFHEVGHGLEMNHVTDPGDVMYPDIAGDKDFNTYLQRVRTYMADTGS